jgi:hypothetical protein
VSDDHRPEPEEDERSRTLNNIFLLAFFILLVGSGIWIVNVMLDVRKMQDCVGSGRRNCAPIDVPVNER